MSWRIAPPCALLVALAGCAGTATPNVPDDHPASVRAEATPLPPRSTTLAISTGVTSAASAGAPAAPQHDHSAHGGHDAHGAAPTAAQSGQPPTPATGGATAAGAYVCPMHPEVVSAKADDRCPKCKMKLRAKLGGATPTTAAPAAAAAPATTPAAPGGHLHDHGGHPQ